VVSGEGAQGTVEVEPVADGAALVVVGIVVGVGFPGAEVEVVEPLSGGEVEVVDGIEVVEADVDVEVGLGRVVAVVTVGEGRFCCCRGVVVSGTRTAGTNSVGGVGSGRTAR